MDCELCKLVNGNVITKEYYSNSLVTVVDCETCGVPMVVLNRHSMDPTEVELDEMIDKAVWIGNEVFKRDNYLVDRKQSQIKDHLHWHIRRKE